MMVAVFAALLCAFVAGWFGRRRLAAACIGVVLALGLVWSRPDAVYGFQRRSSVVGSAGFGGSSCSGTGPGVCPCGQNLARRRASASFALTGIAS